PAHPVTGEPWPPMPPAILDAWRDLCPDAPDPEACLINFYGPDARMGLHQDRDEETFDAPVLSISIGATAVFRIGGLNRRDPTRSIRLASGDAVVLGGAARLAHHGVDRIIKGTSELVKDDGRINLTLRRVTPPKG
ncbi:MAG: alpha-ketoglutarate-dependent dioxygenase AlkB, partial [Alphaproteobacteria bacterium]|nr:alpha-ketoglutarate-dependent dioxygenase AlkB [Alphaproteobacteria bacterium]